MPVHTIPGTADLGLPECAVRHVATLRAAVLVAKVAHDLEGDPGGVESSCGATAALEALLEGLGARPPFGVCTNVHSPNYSPTARWVNPAAFEPVTDILEFCPRDRRLYEAALATAGYQLRLLCDHP
jgi:hypothetical protein